MDEQLVAFAGLFRVCARALRKLDLLERADDGGVLLDVADQLEGMAAKLEQHVEGKRRS